MNPQAFYSLAARLLRHPVVPYHEHAVRAEVEAICAEQGLACERDPFGNLLVRIRTAPARRPLVLAAHLDHPGFELLRPLGPRRWLARFRGSVPETYFRRGTPLRVLPGPLAAGLGRSVDRTERTYEVLLSRTPSTPPQFAVWELVDCAVRGRRLHARSCDDVLGCAALLATLLELKRRRAPTHVIGVFSRAEEVGFHGALALAAQDRLPRNALVISLETSRELPGAVMGQGVIIRVGDRASVFDPAALRFLTEVATALGANGGFQFQRALMGGGTCEATAFQEFGYCCAAACIALGNYHNCGRAGRIEAEYVSLADACGMVDLLTAAADQMPQYRALTGRLPKRLHKLLAQARPALRRTAADP